MPKVLLLSFFALLSGCALDAKQAGAEARIQPESSLTNVADVELMLNDGRTAIMASINGGPEQLINYDTGSQGIVIRRSWAEKLKLPVVGEALLGSPMGGEPVPVKIVGITSLSVGGVSAIVQPRSLDAVMLDDSKFISNANMIIGNNQFPNTLIELDFKSMRFRLGAAGAIDSSTWNPTNDRGLLEGKMSIGSFEVPVHIDSGNPGFLDLPAHLASKLPLTGPLTSAGKTRTVDREMEVQSAELNAEATLADTKFLLNGSFRFAPMPFANFGAKALSNSTIRVDTANKRWQVQFSAGVNGALQVLE